MYKEELLNTGGENMDCRLALIEDLTEIKAMYSKLIEKMNNEGIEIWDDIYPCEFFEKDIENENLYIMLQNNIIVGAFALCEEHIGQKYIDWEEKGIKAVYIDRLGVNIDFSKQGIATKLLTFASKVAKEKTAKYLRLFVIESNIPAIRLYEKFGFKKANGIYTEIIDENLSFEEFGYELQI